MNEIIKKETIENMIYEIRGVQVILDRDLAKLYQVETKKFMQAVKRNIKKFPDYFMFQLSKEEFMNWRSQFVTSKNDITGLRRPPYAFTEYGVAMLAGVLHSDIATNVNITIIDTFVKMRHYLNYNNLLPNKVLLLEEKVDNNTKRIDELFDKFNPKDIIKDKIFFEGQFYDAFSFLMELLNKSKKEIIIIDNYASKELLDILKNINKKIIIVSKNIDEILKNKYEKQYDNIKFINNNSFHDRFIILDRNELYSCGSSFKDLGKKCFYIGNIDNNYLSELLKIINKKA